MFNKKVMIPSLLLVMAALTTAGVLYYGNGLDFVFYATEHWVILLVTSTIIIMDIYLAFYVYQQTKDDKREE